MSRFALLIHGFLVIGAVCGLVSGYLLALVCRDVGIFVGILVATKVFSTLLDLMLEDEPSNG